MEKRYKILQLVDEFLPNISEAIRSVDNYSSRLVRNHEVIVATTQEKLTKIAKEYPIIAKNDINKLKILLRNEKLDIIHVHSIGKVMDMAISLAKEKNIPVVATLHNNEIAEILSKYGKGLRARIRIKKIINRYNALDELFVSSPFVSESLREYGFRGKVSYLPLGSDLETSLRKKQLVELANQEYGLKDTDNILISIGNVRVTKRIDFALNALRLLKEKGVSFKYFIIGPGEEIPHLKELSSYLGLNDRVNFLGYTQDDNMSAIMARADLLLYPSTYDYYGMAKIESAGLGLAGVYVKDSFVASEVFHEINGYISPNNIEAYAKTIEKALSDRSKLKEVSKMAYQDHYRTWDVCAEMLDNRLKGVIEEKIGLSRKLRKSKRKESYGKRV